MTPQLTAGAKLAAVLGVAALLPQSIPPLPPGGWPAAVAWLVLGAGGILWVWRQSRELLRGNGHARAVDRLRSSLDALKTDIEGRLTGIETHMETNSSEINRLRDAIADVPVMIGRAVEKVASTMSTALLKSEDDARARMDRQDQRMDGLSSRIDQQRSKR